MEIHSNFLYLVLVDGVVSGDCIVPIIPSHSLRQEHTEEVCKLLLVLQILVAKELKSSGEDSRENPKRGLACLVSDPPSSLFSFLSCSFLLGTWARWPVL